MGIAMNTYVVPLICQLSHKLRMCFTGLAEYKKTGFDLMPRQQIQERWGKPGIRAVIEG
jgi:hypothetical protein